MPEVKSKRKVVKPNATVLDVCCGSRMFWFDRDDDRAIFLDKRSETHTLKDSSTRKGTRELNISPDLQGDFTDLPFADCTFRIVVFDPPHLIRSGDASWLAKKYGKLEGDWKAELQRAFAECFRVLVPGGTLVFKWNEYQIKVSEILALTPERPLFGNRSGRSSKTHWIVFQKSEVEE